MTAIGLLVMLAFGPWLAARVADETVARFHADTPRGEARAHAAE